MKIWREWGLLWRGEAEPISFTVVNGTVKVELLSPCCHCRLYTAIDDKWLQLDIKDVVCYDCRQRYRLSKWVCLADKDSIIHFAHWFDCAGVDPLESMAQAARLFIELQNFEAGPE